MNPNSRFQEWCQFTMQFTPPNAYQQWPLSQLKQFYYNRTQQLQAFDWKCIFQCNVGIDLKHISCDKHNNSILATVTLKVVYVEHANMFELIHDVEKRPYFDLFTKWRGPDYVAKYLDIIHKSDAMFNVESPTAKHNNLDSSDGMIMDDDLNADFVYTFMQS